MNRPFHFAKSVPKIPTYTLDVDGRKIAIESREDEEQGEKYEEIIDILISGGYFRAKITGLSAFDKVVGGMAWCINTGDVDIDVDLLFHDSLTIGQKISLTEKIVVVLPKIKCPHTIEPHQIQGLDFIHILPIIKWLVKWSSDNRARKATYLRKQALNKFYKYFPNRVGDEEHEECFSYSLAVKSIASRNNNSVTRQNEEFERLTNELDNLKIIENDLLRKISKMDEKLTVIDSWGSRKNVEIDLSEYSESERVAINTILSLLEERNRLKTEENIFKNECVSRLNDLQNEISFWEEKRSNVDEIKAELESIESKIRNGKAHLVELKKETLALEREIDTVPSREELNQYQRRYLELSDLMNIRHKETKQQYVLYNTLNERCQYLQRQFNLLLSVQDSFERGIVSQSGRDDFLNELANIAAGVEQTKLKVQKRKEDEFRKMENSKEEINLLHERKTTYASALKEFSKECDEYEALLQKFKNQNA